MIYISFNKYTLKYDNFTYHDVNFNQIVSLLLKEKENILPLTNRLLLIEMLKIMCIVEKKFLVVINSKEKNFSKSYDYILNINDDKSIINLINELGIAEII